MEPHEVDRGFWQVPHLWENFKLSHYVVMLFTCCSQPCHCFLFCGVRCSARCLPKEVEVRICGWNKTELMTFPRLQVCHGPHECDRPHCDRPFLHLDHPFWYEDASYLLDNNLQFHTRTKMLWVSITLGASGLNDMKIISKAGTMIRLVSEKHLWTPSE